MAAAAQPPWFAGFKAAVFCLLVLNTVVFTARGTLSEAIDSIAWFTLLLLFEAETTHAARLSSARAVAVMHAVRVIAGAAVLAAAVGYLYEDSPLDAVNAWLWIGVVVLLEVEVRLEHAVSRHRRLFATVASLLYGSLALAAAAWAWRGEWFDAYDAALWLVAFAAIEMNVLAGLDGKRAAAA